MIIQFKELETAENFCWLIAVMQLLLLPNCQTNSTDSGHPVRELAFLSIPLAIAIIFQLIILKPITANKTEV
jgi:hypothetical protein